MWEITLFLFLLVILNVTHHAPLLANSESKRENMFLNALENSNSSQKLTFLLKIEILNWYFSAIPKTTTTTTPEMTLAPQTTQTVDVGGAAQIGAIGGGIGGAVLGSLLTQYGPSKKICRQNYFPTDFPNDFPELHTI